MKLLSTSLSCPCLSGGVSSPSLKPPVRPTGTWPRVGPRVVGKFTPVWLPLMACLSGVFPVRSVTCKSTSPTPCSAACMGRSAPFPWRRGSTSHSPTSPRTARASSSACPGTDAHPVGPRPEPGALPLSIIGPHLIADPCCRPIEISSQGSCRGGAPLCLLSGASPEGFFLASFVPIFAAPTAHGPRSTNQRPRRPDIQTTSHLEAM